MEASRITVRVRYAETDRMGYAYYGSYFAWLEVGRVEMLRQMGFAYAELEDSGVFLPVSETSCRYISPARYDEELVVETRLADLGKGSATFDTRVLRADGVELVAEARTKLACVGPDGKPRRLPEEMIGALEGASAAKGCKP